jgi:hypothetical protein
LAQRVKDDPDKNVIYLIKNYKIVILRCSNLSRSLGGHLAEELVNTQVRAIARRRFSHAGTALGPLRQPNYFPSIAGPGACR